MYEFSIAWKYLLPRKKHLSRSLIALMSVGVITLVVWLVLLFLSINEGIQKRWVAHLTTLNAPLQITPTDAYFSSYYYQIDSFAALSDYTLKTLGQKRASAVADPYDPSCDAEVPRSLPHPDVTPNGEVKDLVKELFSAIDSMKTKQRSLYADEYEVAAGVLKMKLTQYDSSSFLHPLPKRTLISQAAYLKSFSGEKNTQDPLLLPLTTEDVEKLLGSLDRLSLFHLANTRVFPYLSDMQFTTIPSKFSIRGSQLTAGKKYTATLKEQSGVSFFVIGDKNANGTLTLEDETLTYVSSSEKRAVSAGETILFFDTPFVLDVREIDSAGAHSVEELRFHVESLSHGLSLTIPWKNITLSKVRTVNSFKNLPEEPPLWVYTTEEDGRSHLPALDGYTPILLPKNLRENGMKAGETGAVCYPSFAATSVQENELPTFAVGFYDPGAIHVGIRFVLADQAFVHNINASSASLPIDKGLLNGIQVWYPDIRDTKEVKKALTHKLEETGLAPYFTVTAFYEYESIRDLMQQFQSDQYLFSLVALLILVVACSNIITLSLLLVNDKKKEIGILRSLGARTQSIALIFGLCGALTGLLSTGLGIMLAFFTLKNIDTLIGLLSYFQGHDLFGQAFFGSHLPSTLSQSALIFVGITTPIIALLAGLVPASKACKLNTTTILRGDG